ncbi:hypothetical protein [Calothrix sp. NIES-2098]|uniref:hypothetical protein n=1 Tax=Calothrix sp. NIES-2098 TaxID=1954171 RepID=UPI000B61C4AD|nr:hypothetical protein NIES2098_09150 [Calothrix sp. NIES-2098]
MQTKLFWFMLGILLWVGFGALIGGLGAMIVRYTWVLSVVGYGAAIGAMSGFIVTSLGLAIAARVRSPDVIVWILLGSIVGAGIGFKSVVFFGHYPHGSQADLSFLRFAPIGLAIGTLLGIVFAIGIWKSQSR